MSSEIVRQRAAFYIDAFNLYHGINDYGEPHLKWLNLWQLANSLIPQRSETLVRVVWCSAYPHHDKDKLHRHKRFVTAQKHYGVTPLMGHYIQEPHSCRRCGDSWEQAREKQTDVNLGLSLIGEAHQDIFDHAYLVTADSDQGATARYMAEHFADKDLTSVCPPNRVFSDSILRHGCNKIQLSKRHIEKCLLPRYIQRDDHTVVVRRPEEYDPPPGWRPSP